MDYILSFEDVDKGSLPLVGGKNASLGEMIKSGIRVPPGFAVTTESYLSFITETGIKDEILKVLSKVSPDDVRSLDNAGQKIKALINSVSIPAGIQDTIRNA